MTTFAARMLGVAAAAAAGVLAVQFAYHLRYCLNADPGAVTVRFTCGADDHHRCPAGCSRWRRGFAVFAEDRLELWEYRSLDAGPAYCVANADFPTDGQIRVAAATDRGTVLIEQVPPLQPLVLPGPAVHPATTFRVGGTR